MSGADEEDEVEEVHGQPYRVPGVAHSLAVVRLHRNRTGSRAYSCRAQFQTTGAPRLRGLNSGGSKEISPMVELREMRPAVAFLAVTLGIGIGACSSSDGTSTDSAPVVTCSKDPRAETFKENLTHPGDNIKKKMPGLTFVLAMATDEPPAVENQIVDVEDPRCERSTREGCSRVFAWRQQRAPGGSLDAGPRPWIRRYRDEPWRRDIHHRQPQLLHGRGLVDVHQRDLRLHDGQHDVHVLRRRLNRRPSQHARPQWILSRTAIGGFIASFAASAGSRSRAWRRRLRGPPLRRR